MTGNKKYVCVQMRKTIFILIITLTHLGVSTQNLFPVKLDKCPADNFCLDCGDIKAGYDESEFKKLQKKLNRRLELQGIKGGVVRFQMLVDSSGKACVLSHTDLSKDPITTIIIKELNNFKKWTPSITAGKKEISSINLIFRINDNKITGQVERVDPAAFFKAMDVPQNPEILNKKFTYNNEHLKKYNVTVWNSKNSNLPNNMIDDITMDRSGLIWLTIHDGLVTFDGKEFSNAEQNITDKGKYFRYHALTTDNENTKWVNGKDNIYSYDNSRWKKYDSAEIGIQNVFEIINNPKTGEVFFCSEKGLTIYKDGKWSVINTSTVQELPSNRFAFAKRDSRNRIWIGTFNGSVMIDENGHAVSFEDSSTVLKGKCITSMAEDDQGNLYFTLYEFNRKDKSKMSTDEGIAIRYNDGTFKQFTSENSGMPHDHANDVLYDKAERVIWISTIRAGLVRYDLKDGWENYHNQNSDIPTSYISEMTFDDKGTLYLATRQGLVKIERK
jgi:ligand-binding sensor domain-containing protein